MIKIKTIMEYMEALAPTSLAYEWDNVGLLVGDESRSVRKILTALELSDDVLTEAIGLGCELVVTHHPVMLRPISAINGETPLGRRLLKAIEEKVAVYCAHTNLDIAKGGTNDVLFDALGLKDPEFLIELEGGYGMGRVGVLENPLSLKAFAKIVKGVLGLSTVTYIGDGDAIIRKVGLCTGSGGSEALAAAKAGCDVYITGDLRYHDAMDALALPLNIIDGTHYATEVLIARRLREYLLEQLKIHGNGGVDVFTSKAAKQPFQSI